MKIFRSRRDKSKNPVVDVVPPAISIENFTLCDRDGLTLLLDRTSMVDQFMIDRGHWESNHINLMREAVRKLLVPTNGVFLDVGAYWGLYAMRAVQEGAKEVHAFEPDPRNYAQLQAQLFLNDMLDAVSIHSLAASDAEGSTLFRKSVQGQNRAGAGIPRGKKGGSVEVAKIRLDDMFDWNGRSIVVKMDVEGHEPFALRGMANLVKRNEVLLQAEVFDHDREATMAAAKEIGLRHILTVHVDRYLTNMSDQDLCWFYEKANEIGLRPLDDQV